MGTAARNTENSGMIEVSDTLNKLDLVSIEALISYKAHHHQVEEAFIKRAVLTHFKIAELKKLPRTMRDTAIRFLVDYSLPANAR